MTLRERISHSIRAAAAGGEPALVAYLTAGFRYARGSASTRGRCRVADVVEVGVPLTDPMADGVTIRARARPRRRGACLS